ncbi:MAG: type II secretion system protein GspL [Pseudomonadota bacterium]
METLFIRFLASTELHSVNDETSVRWIITSSDESEENCGIVKLANIPELIQDRRVIILLPIETLYITTVTLQTKNRKQLEKAIPFALEDDLTEDIENLHFSYGQRTHDNQIPVIVISNRQLDELLSNLNELRIIPDIITADIFGLPWTEDNRWTARIESNHAIVRTTEWSGFACETSDIIDFISLASLDEEQPPEVISVKSHPDENITELKKLANVIVEDHWSPTALVDGFDQSQYINLLQGSYAKQDKQHKTVLPWKIAAGLAAVWLAITMLHVSVEYYQYKDLNSKLTAEIDQTLLETFPDIQRIPQGAARSMMEQRLKRLDTQDGSTDNETDFLKLLHQSGYELSKDQNISIIDFDYKNNELSLDIKASDIQILENVKTKLKSRNINAELQTAKNIDDYVLARMDISE